MEDAATVGGPAAAAPPPFLMKTYDMVDDPATDAVVSWGAGNNSFVVWNPPEFARDLLPKYFKHSNFSSFVRQLNTYGFRKVDPDKWEFANEGFLRGQKHLLKTINRRKSSHGHNQPPQPQTQNPSIASCVEVGKFGLEEEIERLKRDKNVLMQELVRLRQQQQSTDHQLQTVGKRLHGMEQRQQQMMSFLAKAMRSPGFLAQFMQQSDNNRRLSAANKKRRLPNQDSTSESDCESPDGQIIKYQPMINEAAKAMLMKILSYEETNRFESRNNSESFMIQNYVGITEPFDSSSSTQNSGVTLSEVPCTSGFPCIDASNGVSAMCPSSSPPEIQSPSDAAMNLSKDLPSVGNPSSASGADVPSSSMNIPEFPDLSDIVVGDAPVDIPDDFGMPGPDVFLSPFSAESNEANLIETDEMTYDGDEKLPNIMDSFWEQFLATSPLVGEEVSSDAPDATNSPSLLNGCDMANLTEQMGLLSPDLAGR